MPNYGALIAVWPTLSGSDIGAKLSALNSEVVTAAVAGTSGTDVIQGTPSTPAVLWPQSNGWQGTINQNDLVASGVISNADRIAFEQQSGLITAEQAQDELEWATQLETAQTAQDATKLANQILAGDAQ